jgi:acetyltransferase-like isoleucine patch superfamily enzyme
LVFDISIKEGKCDDNNFLIKKIDSLSNHKVCDVYVLRVINPDITADQLKTKVEDFFNFVAGSFKTLSDFIFAPRILYLFVDNKVKIDSMSAEELAKTEGKRFCICKATKNDFVLYNDDYVDITIIDKSVDDVYFDIDLLYGGYVVSYYGCDNDDDYDESEHDEEVSLARTVDNLFANLDKGDKTTADKAKNKAVKSEAKNDKEKENKIKNENKKSEAKITKEEEKENNTDSEPKASVNKKGMTEQEYIDKYAASGVYEQDMIKAAQRNYDILYNDSIKVCTTFGTVTLYRIKANRNINLANGDFIEQGTLGGYIHSTNNLSQKGNCWLKNHSIVFGDVMITDNAVVGENCIIYASPNKYTIIDDCAEIKDDCVIQDSEIDGHTCIGKGLRVSNLNMSLYTPKCYSTITIRDEYDISKLRTFFQYGKSFTGGVFKGLKI